MITKNVMTIALSGVLALPLMAQDEAPAVGDLLQGINSLAPEEGDPAYKVNASEKFGTEWYLDAAYGLWNTEKVPGATRHTNLALIHAALDQRLIEDNANGGTWLRVEFSGTWASTGGFGPGQAIACIIAAAVLYMIVRPNKYTKKH